MLNYAQHEAFILTARSLQVSTVMVHYHDRMFDHKVWHIVKNLVEWGFLVSFDKFINSEIQNISCSVPKANYYLPLGKISIYRSFHL